MKVVCFGDSNTWGYDPKGYLGGRYDHPWPEILAEKLHCTVINWGENGREIPGNAVDFPADTDLLIIMLGTNDAQDGMHDTEDIQDPYNNLISYEPLFETFYQYIIDGVKSANPNALIYLVTPVPVRNCIWRKHQEKYLLQIPMLKLRLSARTMDFSLYLTTGDRGFESRINW